jgi:hypothetical protein
MEVLNENQTGLEINMLKVKHVMINVRNLEQIYILTVGSESKNVKLWEPRWKNGFEINLEELHFVADDRPDLSSEGAPDIDKTVYVKQKLIFGHETQMGLETKTYWSADRRS